MHDQDCEDVIFYHGDGRATIDVDVETGEEDESDSEDEEL